MHDTRREPILGGKARTEIAAERPSRIERKPLTRESRYKQQQCDCGSAQSGDLCRRRNQPQRGKPC